MHYDLLAKIKNAQRARKENLQTPLSAFNLAVAQALVRHGFLREAEVRSAGKRQVLDVKLKYDRDDRPAITDFKIMSKPSRHLYIGYRELKPVRQGYGISILSTPSGIISNREARKQKVGGEYLFEIW